MAFEVFLSHFSEEQSLAEFVQDYLCRVFGERDLVFRSSDSASIPTGHDSYLRIIQVLGEAKVFVALISKYGAPRPWLNFETGFVSARRIPLFPVLVRNTLPLDVPLPMGRLQLRLLKEESVIDEIVEAISKATGAQAGQHDPEWLVRELEKREAQMPDRELRLVPFRTVSGSGSQRSEHLRFEIDYGGPRPVTLVKVWAELPLGLRNPNSCGRNIPGHLLSTEKQSENRRAFRIEWTASLSPADVRFSGTSWQPLHPHLSPSERPIPLKELAFGLRQDPTSEALGEPILCQIVTEDGETPIAEHKLGEIEIRPGFAP